MQPVKQETRSVANGVQTSDSLTEIVKGIQEHISAIHAAIRDHLTQQSATRLPRPDGIEITIKVGVDELANGGGKMRSDTTCWKHVYPCGMTPTGYIMCETTVCMTVGPVTVES